MTGSRAARPPAPGWDTGCLMPLMGAGLACLTAPVRAFWLVFTAVKTRVIDQYMQVDAYP